MDIACEGRRQVRPRFPLYIKIRPSRGIACRQRRSRREIWIRTLLRCLVGAVREELEPGVAESAVREKEVAEILVGLNQRDAPQLTIESDIHPVTEVVLSFVLQISELVS